MYKYAYMYASNERRWRYERWLSYHIYTRVACRSRRQKQQRLPRHLQTQAPTHGFPDWPILASIEMCGHTDTSTFADTPMPPPPRHSKPRAHKLQTTNKDIAGPAGPSHPGHPYSSSPRTLPPPRLPRGLVIHEPNLHSPRRLCLRHRAPSLRRVQGKRRQTSPE